KGDTETTVVTWAGDGGTFDIGFQALSGAVERNEDFIYVCYDNEAY
ncbi:MAG TPA: pyruvate synthase subunit beta, partial [Syntrophobacteraceae bacterium]|nr:pyruvate synthase subunit beta [Syntrophobacteraceae bacterium]